MLKALNIKIKTSLLFIATIQVGMAITASKEIFCYARNFFLTVRSGLNWVLLG